MKKGLLILLILLIFGCASSSQSSIMEGYDGFAWGTSVEEIKEKYPDLSDKTNSNFKNVNSQLYLHKESDKVFKLFCFYDNRLSDAGIIYFDPPSDLTENLTNEIKATYGKPVFVLKNKFKGKDETTWYYTKSFSIDFGFIDPASYTELGDFKEGVIFKYYNGHMLEEAYKKAKTNYKIIIIGL